MWCWTKGRKQPFARITEQKREALIKRQQQPSTELPNGASNIDGKKWTPTSVKEVGVERRWKKVSEVNDPQPYLTVRITAQEKARGVLTQMCCKSKV